jgi:asparagine synthase (glutamine-hydrolysing)
MCGIAGIFDTQAFRSIDRYILNNMNDSISHRGPDAQGLYTKPGIGLAHRRLSIIDLQGGKQPIEDESRKFVLVFNGEIYNFISLREQLLAFGHSFKTNSDSEVLLKAYMQWGSNCVQYLRGMFAFAIWDNEKQQLFLARDRLGIKPLYFTYLPSGHFIFGSELKSLQVHPEFQDKLCPFAIQEFFAYGYVPDPKSIYQGVYKLSPGHSLNVKWGEHSLNPVKYWDIDFSKASAKKPELIKEELVHYLDDSVKARMIADVPLGAFLSGGVDSSAVVSSMSLQDSRPVKTCAIGFAEKKFNEADYARQVAKHCKTDHVENIVSADDCNLMSMLPTLFDEPFADSSAIPTYRVCEHARKLVKVALSGDGGDEIFAGYRRYRGFMREEQIRNAIPNIIRKPLFGVMASVYPKLDFAPRIFRAKSTFEVLARDTVSGYFHNIAIYKDYFRNRIFSETFLRDTQGYHPIEVFNEHRNNYNSDDLLSLVQYLDIKTYLPGDILTKVDRTSMAHGLEVRVPLLDHHFVEWSSRVLSSQKLHKNVGKHIFKKSLEHRLPHDILYRKKQGFAIPISKWFKHDLNEHLQSLSKDSHLLDCGFFNQKFIKKLTDGHTSGANDFSSMLWTLCAFEQFLQHTKNKSKGTSKDAYIACA